MLELDLKTFSYHIFYPDHVFIPLGAILTRGNIQLEASPVVGGWVEKLTGHIMLCTVHQGLNKMGITIIYSYLVKPIVPNCT